MGSSPAGASADLSMLEPLLACVPIWTSFSMFNFTLSNCTSDWLKFREWSDDCGTNTNTTIYYSSSFSLPKQSDDDVDMLPLRIYEAFNATLIVACSRVEQLLTLVSLFGTTFDCKRIAHLQIVGMLWLMFYLGTNSSVLYWSIRLAQFYLWFSGVRGTQGG